MDTKLEVNITFHETKPFSDHFYLNSKQIEQIYDGDDYSLEGDMSVPMGRRNTSQPGQPDFNTLDEPIKETIVRIVFMRLNRLIY